MRNPVMDSDPTRVPGDDRPTPHVSPTTSVRDARMLLARARADALVVEDGGEPVGVVTARALLGTTPAVPAGTPVADVMDYEAVRVEPGARERTTMRADARATWASLWRRHGGLTTRR